MRIINILGLIINVFPLIYKYNSKRALLIFMNGIIFHSNEDNYYLKYYDIICNIIMILWTNYYHYTKTLNLSVISVIMFVMNNLLYTTAWKNKRNLSDIYHVLGVHLPLSIALERSLKVNI
jgi:hypothetical protein